MKKTLKNKKSNWGFTLIELTIAIAIIGILSTIIITSLGSAREKGRDAKRIRNIQEIRTAIELYIAANGHAPDLGDSNCIDPTVQDIYCFTNDWSGGTAKLWDDFTAQLNPYMKTVPKDPCGLACYNNDGLHKHEGYFEYVYQAPAMISPLNDPPNTVITSSSYRIYATNLEKDNPKSFGFGPGSF